MNIENDSNRIRSDTMNDHRRSEICQKINELQKYVGPLEKILQGADDNSSESKKIAVMLDILKGRKPVTSEAMITAINQVLLKMFRPRKLPTSSTIVSTPASPPASPKSDQSVVHKPVEIPTERSDGRDCLYTRIQQTNQQNQNEHHQHRSEMHRSLSNGDRSPSTSSSSSSSSSTTTSSSSRIRQCNKDITPDDPSTFYGDNDEYDDCSNLIKKEHQHHHHHHRSQHGPQQRHDFYLINGIEDQQQPHEQNYPSTSVLKCDRLALKYPIKRKTINTTSTATTTTTLTTSTNICQQQQQQKQQQHQQQHQINLAKISNRDPRFKEAKSPTIYSSYLNDAEIERQRYIKSRQAKTPQQQQQIQWNQNSQQQYVQQPRTYGEYRRQKVNELSCTTTSQQYTSYDSNENDHDDDDHDLVNNETTMTKTTPSIIDDVEKILNALEGKLPQQKIQQIKQVLSSDINMIELSSSDQLSTTKLTTTPCSTVDIKPEASATLTTMKINTATCLTVDIKPEASATPTTMNLSTTPCLTVDIKPEASATSTTMKLNTTPCLTVDIKPEASATSTTMKLNTTPCLTVDIKPEASATPIEIIPTEMSINDNTNACSLVDENKEITTTRNDVETIPKMIANECSNVEESKEITETTPTITKKRPKKKSNEVERLNEDIRTMFISEGVLCATGKRNISATVTKSTKIGHHEETKVPTKITAAKISKRRETIATPPTRRSTRNIAAATTATVAAETNDEKHTFTTTKDHGLEQQKQNHIVSEPKKSKKRKIKQRQLKKLQSKKTLTTERNDEQTLMSTKVEKQSKKALTTETNDEQTLMSTKVISHQKETADEQKQSEPEKQQQTKTQLSDPQQSKKMVRKKRKLPKNEQPVKKRVRRILPAINIVERSPSPIHRPILLPKRKRRHTTTEPSVEQPKKQKKNLPQQNDMMMDQDENIKNTNNDMHCLNAEFNKTCVFCKYSGALVSHYVNHHRAKEVFISRLSPTIATKLHDTTNEIHEQIGHSFRDKQNLKIKHLCYFCMTDKSFTRDGWIVHFSQHTGEYRFGCDACKRLMASRPTNQHPCNIDKRKMYKTAFDQTKLYASICRLCNFTQFDEKRIQQHIKLQHNIEANIADEDDDDDALQQHYSKIEFLRYTVGNVSNGGITTKTLADKQDNIHSIEEEQKEATAKIIGSNKNIDNDSVVDAFLQTPSKNIDNDIEDDDTLFDPITMNIMKDVSFNLSRQIIPNDDGHHNVDDDNDNDNNDKSGHDINDKKSMAHKLNERFKIIKNDSTNCDINNDNVNNALNNVNVTLSSSLSKTAPDIITSTIDSTIVNDDCNHKSNVSDVITNEQIIDNNNDDNEHDDDDDADDGIKDNDDDWESCSDAETELTDLSNLSIDMMQKINNNENKKKNYRITQTVHRLYKSIAQKRKQKRLASVAEKKLSLSSMQDAPFIPINDIKVEIEDNESAIQNESIIDNENRNDDDEMFRKLMEKIQLPETSDNDCLDIINSIYNNSSDYNVHEINIDNHSNQQHQQQQEQIKLRRLSGDRLSNSIQQQNQLKPWINSNSNDKQQLLSILDKSTKMLSSQLILYAFYKCMNNSCIYATNSLKLWLLHLYQHNIDMMTENIDNADKLLFECSYCNYYHEKFIILIKHQLEQHKSSIYQCELCFYRSADEFNVITHYKQWHTNIFNYDKLLILKCFNNIDSIKSMTNLNDKRNMNVLPLKCNQDNCSENFYNIDKYLKHIKKQHLSSTTTNNEILCQFCDLNNLNFDNIVEHLKTSHYLSCIHCKFTSDNVTNIQQHMANQHSNELLVICVRYKKMMTPMNDTIDGTTTLARLNSPVKNELIKMCPYTNDQLNNIETVVKDNNIESSSFLFEHDACKNQQQLNDITNNENDDDDDMMTNVDRLNVKSTINDEFNVNNEQSSTVITKNIKTINQIQPFVITNVCGGVPWTKTSATITTKASTLSSSSSSASSTTSNCKVQIEIDKAAYGLIKGTGFHGKSLYRCNNDNCKTSLSNSDAFKLHLSQHINDDNKQEKSKKCYHCDKQQKTNDHYLIHLKQCHYIHQYFCYFCNYTSSLTSSMGKHLKNTHQKIDHKNYSINSSASSASTAINNKKPLSLYISGPNGLHSTDIHRYSMKLIDRYKLISTKNFYSPHEIDDIPTKSIFNDVIGCTECNFTTKVRINFQRHLRQHLSNNAVTFENPVNPVPCLDTGEKHFDKMINLADSSNTVLPSITPSSSSSSSSSSTTSTSTSTSTTTIPLTTIKTPTKSITSDTYHYVDDTKRYKCPIINCLNRNFSNELTLRQHINQCHINLLTTIIKCVHCDDDKIVLKQFYQHLRQHGAILYYCKKCSYQHCSLNKIEIHAIELHNGTRTTLNKLINKHNRRTLSSSSSSSSSTKTVNQFSNKEVNNQCTSISITSPSKLIDSNHRQSKVNRWQCQICFEIYKNRIDVEEHMKNVHSLCNTNDGIRYFFQRIRIDDITPIWRRDDPNKVKHIRGILFDDTNDDDNDKD